MHPIDPSSSMIMKSVGHYGRRVTAKAGGLSLKIPKPRGKASRSQLVERYRRREESVGEALMEMYPAGDVSGGSEHASRGRHQPTAAGRADALADAFRQAQENLRGNRRMMRAPPGGRIPVRVRGRRAAQAPVGRKRGERGRARRHRGRRRGAPRGDRGRRGHEGGRGQLGAVLLQVHDRTRTQGRATGAPAWRPPSTRRRPRRSTNAAWRTSCATCSPGRRQATASGRPPP